MRRLLSVTVLPLVLAAGCGGESPDAQADGPAATPKRPGAITVEPPAQPQTLDAARRAAKEHMDAYAAGDYGGAWELWSADAKKLLDRAEYVKLSELCPATAEGAPIKIEAVRMSADQTKATVRAERMSFKFTYTYRYEEGRWVFAPDAETMAEYRLGSPEKIAAKRKREGGCG